MENKADVQLYGTSDLCFDKDVFMRPDFNVDDFMREYNQLNGNTNLEMLRDHLGVYLKVLRSAMIDLINRDYADFVNLSTNLTGIDSLIQTLTVPLEKLREEVLSVSQMLETASSGVMSDLQKQDAVLKYKKKLSTLSIIAKKLDNFEDLISHLSLDSESPMQQKAETKPEISNNAASPSAPWTGIPETPSTEETTSQNLCAEVCSQEELLHRLAAELSHLNYLGSTCEGTHLMSIYKPHIERIQSAVEACIESNFRTALGGDFCRGSTTSCNITLLKHTLVACTVLGRPGVVQRVLRDILSPLIQQTVSDESLRSNPRGLTGVLSSLLSQLKTCLAPLLALTVPRKHHSRYDQTVSYA
ncbi:hypothetical protein HAZT_HAZT007094 [Hyalella azteca]|uniref:Conserved oligomeric Golgi complex subunit 2 n=1 Tax=Hyalella azteca TaxID=294128 RepID=A0A6A0H2S5_HYAAZ|nr:hypothetical protein HAZT_HAZT007094 [Hyalella azteca]